MRLSTSPHFSDKNLKVRPVSGLVLLQLLLPLPELALGVADVAAEAVAVEVVVAARLGERLALLDKKATKRGSSAAHYIYLASGGQQSKWEDLFHRRKQSVEAAHLKVIQANDTVSMRNITFSQDFFCFL